MERVLQFIEENALKAGDRVVVPKSMFEIIQHHAIYLGWLDSDYYFIENKEGIGVRLITAYDFFEDAGKISRIERFMPSGGYSRSSLINKALSLVGRKYDLWNYNCENFANELQYARSQSDQVSLVKRLMFVLLLFFAAKALLE
jgi:hypothetical protein